ncbi:hypothetical protein K2X33_08995 [bacterium]|nr:hypothetical protein [bacterium]
MRLGIWGVLAVFSVSVWAADLDVAGAKARYDQQHAVVAGAKTVLRTDEQEFQRANNAHMTEVGRENTANSRVTDLESKVQSTNSDIQRWERDVPRLESEVRQKDADRVSLENRIQQQQREQQHREMEVRRAEGELRRAEKELADEQAKPTPDASRVTQLAAEKARKDQDLRRAKQEAAQIDQDIQHNRRLLQDRQSDVRQAQDNLDQTRVRLAQANRTYQQQQTDLQSARDDLRRQQDATLMAKNRMEDARTQMNRSSAEVTRQEVIAQQAYQYYQQVVANYNAEYNKVVRAAQTDAGADAEREASDRAPQAGSQDGVATAVSVGQTRGTEDGRKRELAAGYQNARKNTALDTASYQKGDAQGRSDAEKEAAGEDFPAGYNKALESTLAGTPGSVTTIDLERDTPQGQSGDGGAWLEATPRVSVGVRSPGVTELREPAYVVPSTPAVQIAAPVADKRYFSPDCNNQVLPEFVGLCQTSYQNAYAAAFEASYKLKYGEGFQAAFSNKIQAEYDRALKQAFPGEFKQGIAQGAYDQGTVDGYAARITAARSEAFAKGASEWATYLASGHLVRIGSTRLSEASGDGLFTPGENAGLTLVVDNLGGKPVPETTLRAVLTQTEGAVPTKKDVTLPALNANARTVLRGVVAAQIAPAFAGANIRLKADLQRSGASAKTLEATGQVHFPLELQKVEFSAKPKVDQEVAGVLRFKNMLSGRSAATAVALTVSPQVATFAGDALQIPELEPGAEGEVAVKVTPGVWTGGNFDIPLNVQTENVGGIQGAVDQKFLAPVAVDRSASLLLYDWNGKEVRDGTIDVKAGDELRFQLVFQLHRTGFTPGPFWVGSVQTSDPGVRNAPNSTVSIGLGSASPGTQFQPVAFRYNIPAAMAGKSGWVLVTLREGNRNIHVAQVHFNAK